MKAVVVGAGFAGLAAAARLAGAGAEVDVFEARDRVGGRVWSVPFAGGVVELGAEFILPGNETVIATAQRLGLPLVRKGTQYGDREPRGDARTVSREQVAAAAARIASEARPAFVPGGTLADALETYRLDPAVAEAIRSRVEVSCGYPADDLEPSVLRETGAAFGPFDTYTVEGGNDRIARELAAGLGDSVHLASPVRRVVWDEGGVRIRAGSHVVVADAAVVAVPASTVGAISFDPPLPDDTAAAMLGVRYGHAAKLFVRLGAPVPPSATLSVPGRFWCWTQLGADGAPAPFVGAFAAPSGRSSGFGTSRPDGVARGPGVAAPRPSARLWRRAHLHLAGRSLGPRGLLGRVGELADRHRGADPPGWAARVRRRAHRR